MFGVESCEHSKVKNAQRTQHAAEISGANGTGKYIRLNDVEFELESTIIGSLLCYTSNNTTHPHLDFG